MATKVYPIDLKAELDLVKRFTYHPPVGDQTARYEELRRKALNLAQDIVMLSPPSREQSIALTNLEQTIFWANAAIARGE